jgi:hypothetical protein
VRATDGAVRSLCRSHFEQFDVDREVARQRHVHAEQKVRAGR